MWPRRLDITTTLALLLLLLIALQASKPAHGHTSSYLRLILRHRQDLQQSMSVKGHSNNKYLNDRQPRILCWIMSMDTPENNAKSRAVMDTWGSRCDKLLIIKNGTQLAEDTQTRQLTLPIQHDSRQVLWSKVVKTFDYIYDKYLNQYDWFMKADDDTYVVLDRLRGFLAKHSPSEAIYFGHRFKPYVKQGYMSGGSGYVLSREALRRLVESGLNKDLKSCNRNVAAVEDVLMGRCMEAVQVEAGDTRDDRLKLERFLPFNLQAFDDSKTLYQTASWFPKYRYYKTRASSGRIASAQPIALHYMSPPWMRFLDKHLQEKV